MNVAIYVRVSTEQQAEEGYSIEAQLEKLRLYCQAKDWIIIDEYVDGGFSGASVERPALQRLIKDVQNKKMDVVMVYKLDRLSRDQKDTLYLIEDVFQPNGVKFISMQESFDTTTPIGMVMVGLLAVFAQFDRANIKERMKLGKDQRAKAGYHHGGITPIGYDYIPQSNQLTINEYEAMQVRLVYDLFLQGESFEHIRKILNASYTTRYGNTYEKTRTIRRMLQNPMYIGKITSKGKVYDGVHEPIISEEVFNKAQVLYAKALERESISTKPKPYKASTLLGGLLYCGNCGSKYGGNSFRSVYKGKKRCSLTYSCYGRSKDKYMGKDFNCKINIIFVKT